MGRGKARTYPTRINQARLRLQPVHCRHRVATPSSPASDNDGRRAMQVLRSAATSLRRDVRAAVAPSVVESSSGASAAIEVTSTQVKYFISRWVCIGNEVVLIIFVM